MDFQTCQRDNSRIEFPHKKQSFWVLFLTVGPCFLQFISPCIFALKTGLTFVYLGPGIQIFPQPFSQKVKRQNGKKYGQ